MYDVIVVGARCAGSPTAMLLARLGHRVLVLDRAEFPSDTMSTHFMHQSGLSRLRNWGLLDRLAATGCPPLTEAVWWYGDLPIRGSAPAYDGVAEAYAPRRIVLDALLVDAAREAGAEIREGFTVRELIIEDGTVVGVRGRSHGGQEEELRARAVVGADGHRSLVARTMNAEVYKERPSITVAYYTYWTGLKRGYEVYLGNEQQVAVMPTHGDACLIVCALPNAEFGRFRADVEGTYHRIIEDTCPELAKEIREHGQQTEKFTGTKELPNFYRRPYGAGWALAGDAGFHKDPVTGQGIADAFRDADVLSTALHRVLTGTGEWDQEMAAYEETRNQATAALYEFTCLAATLQFSDRMRQAFSVLSYDQAEANAFLGLVAGTTSVIEFFSDEHMGGLVERSKDPEDRDRTLARQAAAIH
ncbi:NAD(P)/FAD-dependent oxidoreductase [Streptomyces sp. SPB162]|uniref:NAD(P)/FAD-dependent oxidoreductase n=1 Tax=Streptomyces sp. SPB162 TaxID=2940560 RepID=UPI002405448F|nr:NAD(P)/FAD-dependent oxidoreductase [Streptomyces sp. SPB162]MDF9817179.1 2-polyprenyl-6-methoxyphenol hydroxylase-like FAD-dependent oxidoreductase [Streptomyces sp. SPB162]